MKLIKYILLIILLVSTTATVFLATLKPDYDIVKHKLINVSSSSVYNYVNNYKNWEDFITWKNADPSMVIYFSKKSFGTDSFCTWSGKNGKGRLQTIAVKENVKIIQQMFYGDEISNIFWAFKDTLGKTKITCRIKGELNFKNKMLNNFYGGIKKIAGRILIQSLEKINHNLDFELNAFNIKVNGYLQKTAAFYLYKTINSKNKDLKNNIQIVIRNLIIYFNENNINMVSKPFVIYNSKDNKFKTTDFSVCISTKTKLKSIPEKRILSGSFLPYTAVKTTLKGDYRHLKLAKQKTENYILNNNLIKDTIKNYTEMYIKTKNDIKNPSEWITEIYVPVKHIVKNNNLKKPLDTVAKKHIQVLKVKSIIDPKPI